MLFLLENFANVNTPNNKGQSVLDLAILNMHKECAKVIKKERILTLPKPKHTQDAYWLNINIKQLLVEYGGNIVSLLTRKATEYQKIELQNFVEGTKLTQLIGFWMYSVFVVVIKYFFLVKAYKTKIGDTLLDMMKGNYERMEAIIDEHNAGVFPLSTIRTRFKSCLFVCSFTIGQKKRNESEY